MAKPAFKLTPPDPNEDQLQESIINLLEAILRPGEALVTHFPAGGYHLSPAARARLYRLGLRRGWPDVVICYGQGRILWLEIKTVTGKLSIDQRQKHLQLEQLGHHVVVCRRIEDVLIALALHGVPFRKAQIDRSYHGTINQGDAQSSTTESTQSTRASTEAINA